MKRALLFVVAVLAFALPAAAFATVPTVTINSDADGIIPATGDVTVKAYATFSEVVSGFDLSDIQITNGTASLLIPQSPTFYSFLVTVQGSGAVTVTATIPADAVQSVSTSENNTLGTDSWNYNSSLTTFTTVSGRSWYDANHDGIRTSSGSCSAAGDNCSPATETDLEGTTITATPVLDAAGTADPDRVVISSVTNSNGGYSFLFGSAVDLGRWRISETLPSGWTQTLPTTTDTFYDVTINDTNGDSNSITRENYASAANYNFGSYDPSLVASVVTPLATPTTTPIAGTYTSVQNVTLGTASSSATTTKMYYSFAPDADPSCSPLSVTLFTGPISIASSTTLKAIACSDASTSTVVSFSFVINIPPDAPTASPATTTSYTSAQDITLADASTTASLYYTSDGTSPLCGVSQPFSSGSPIHLTASAIIEAIACTPTASSSVASFAYVINIPAPAPAPAPSGAAGNGPPSTLVSTNAVIPAAESGVVLGAESAPLTFLSPSSATAINNPTHPSYTMEPAATPKSQGSAPAEAQAAEAPASAAASGASQPAAAGLAPASAGFPSWLLALILAFLLAAGALWFWLASGTSH